ncbi:hypothetical protein OF83DRAFT_1051864 [Amylostereum chailletii]|nr:hypothetical protein OF83DRAFT_1051864 [Amylostereum chailletii]
MPKGKGLTNTTASTSPGRKRGRKPSTKKALDAEISSIDDLRQLKANGVKDHRRATSTNNTYASRLKEMRAWAQGIMPSRTDFEELAASGSAELDMTEFAQAFDGPPKACSPEAVALYISYKSFHEGRSSALMWQCYSAAKGYWEQLSGDTYRGKWYFNERNNRWEGNPCESALVQDTKTAILHKVNANGGERTHAVAMTYPHLLQIITWSERVCPTPAGGHLERDLAQRKFVSWHLTLRAFLSTGWLLWARNFETIKMKRKHIQLCYERDEHGNERPYLRVKLEDRKGWQRKSDKAGTAGNEDLQPNVYHVYDLPHLHGANVFRHLPAWIDYLEHQHYGRALTDDDYLFPTMGANGIVQPKMMSQDTFHQMLVTAASESGVDGLLGGGTFSTHSLRRGGAQYWFMFAPVEQRWTLARIRWWGGWAEGERRDTLVRYLLDELHMYQESHATALRPISPPRVEQPLPVVASRPAGSTSFLPHAPLDVAGLVREGVTSFQQEVQTAIYAAVRNQLAYVQPVQHPPIPTQVEHWQYPPTICINHGFAVAKDPWHPEQVPSDIARTPLTPNIHIPAPVLPSAFVQNSITFPVRVPPCSPSINAIIAASTSPQQRQYTSTRTCHRPSHAGPTLEAGPPPSAARILSLKRLRKDDDASHGWRIILEHWEHGDPILGIIPLKDWPQSWLRGKNRTLFGPKHHTRKVISLEFINKFHRDEARFLAAYPEYMRGPTALFHAIQKAREARGDKRPRQSKNGLPEERLTLEEWDSEDEDNPVTT